MKKLTIILLLIPIIIMVLFSVYNANEKKLDTIEEEIDEKIRIAKEKIQ